MNSFLDDRDIPSRRVNLDKRPPSHWFVCVSPGQANRYFEVFPQHDRTFLVWLAVLNLCRAKKNRRVKFTEKWHRQLPISRRTVTRALRRLQDAGLVTIDMARGHSVYVTLADDISYDLGGRHGRP